MSRRDNAALSFARLLGAGAILSLLIAGCVGSSGAASAPPDASNGPEDPAAASASAAPSAAMSFYLRAWQTQALAPQYTFGSLPTVTISGGSYIDGRVAIPAIYPGPIYVGPSVRPISAEGIAAIVAEARTDGLLGDKTDFSAGTAPGSVLGHIRIVVDGVTHDLTGALPTDASTVAGSPGTSGAFAAFWNRVGTIGMWLAADLGQSAPYTPAGIAVLVAPPADASAGIAPNEVPWPLTTPFATFGQPYGGSVYRCATVAGADLATLGPVVQAANALTRFVDSTGAKMSLQVRVLVPGDEGPCP